jgi:endonuclease-3
MGNSNRTALLNKTHRVLKQQYTPVAPTADRPLLEHLLFALVLENAPFDIAEKIFTHLSKNFFDWNEVRVSTVTELAEVTRPLPDPMAAASNLKRVLQGVFESTYSFDLEPVKKQNISAALKQLERLGGTTPFGLAYVTQVALGGHAIPLDRGALDVLAVLGVISESEAQSGKVSGLERVIPKNKGVEFGSLLHQVAAEFVANPFSPTVRKLLLSINPDAKDRFPKRGAKKDEGHREPHPAAHHANATASGHAAAKHQADGKDKHTDEKGAKAATEKQPEKISEKASGKSAAKTAEKPAEKSAEKSIEKSTEKAPGKGTAEKAAHAAEHSAKPQRSEKGDKSHRASEKAERTESKKPAAGAAKNTDPKHAASKHHAAAKPRPVAAKPKSTSKQLTKRKPR